MALNAMSLKFNKSNPTRFSYTDYRTLTVKGKYKGLNLVQQCSASLFLICVSLVCVESHSCKWLFFL